MLSSCIIIEVFLQVCQDNYKIYIIEATYQADSCSPSVNPKWEMMILDVSGWQLRPKCEDVGTDARIKYGDALVY